MRQQPVRSQSTGTGRPGAAAVVAAVLAAAPVMPAGSAERHAQVRMETELGSITMTLDLARAPRAGAYFLGYVDRGRYDGAMIYRAGSLDGEAAPQLVQGGLLQDAIPELVIYLRRAPQVDEGGTTRPVRIHRALRISCEAVEAHAVDPRKSESSPWPEPTT